MLKILSLPRPFIFCLLILFLSDSALACIGSAGFPGSSLFPQQYPADDAAGSYVAPPSEYKIAPPPPSHYNYAPPTFTLQTLPPFTLPKLETLPPPPPLPQLFSYYPVAPPPPPPSYVLPQFQLQTLPPLQPFTLPPMPTFAPPPEPYYPVKPPKYSTGPDQFSSLSSRREIPPVQTFIFGGSDSSHLPPPPPPPPSTNFERPLPQQIGPPNNAPQPSQQNFNQQNLHQSNNIQSQGLPQTANIRNNMPQHPMPPVNYPYYPQQDFDDEGSDNGQEDSQSTDYSYRDRKRRSVSLMSQSNKGKEENGGIQGNNFDKNQIINFDSKHQFRKVSVQSTLDGTQSFVAGNTTRNPYFPTNLTKNLDNGYPNPEPKFLL
uniref:Uncharacterized protein n=1 Tax=Meloidogyne javanica TaxID=6303 RepID=A0A915MBQ5_MELJA